MYPTYPIPYVRADLLSASTTLCIPTMLCYIYAVHILFNVYVVCRHRCCHQQQQRRQHLSRVLVVLLCASYEWCVCVWFAPNIHYTYFYLMIMMIIKLSCNHKTRHMRARRKSDKGLNCDAVMRLRGESDGGLGSDSRHQTYKENRDKFAQFKMICEFIRLCAKQCKVESYPHEYKLCGGG